MGCNENRYNWLGITIRLDTLNILCDSPWTGIGSRVC